MPRATILNITYPIYAEPNLLPTFDVGDPWWKGNMTTPPTAAGGTWTKTYDTTSAPTPAFEDWAINGITGVRLRVLTTQGNAARHLYMVSQPRPSVAYSVQVRMRVQKITLSNQFNCYGIFFRESGTGHIHHWALCAASGVGWASYNNTTTLNNFLGGDGATSTEQTPFDFWLRVDDDHTANLTYYISLDGNYWVSYGSKAYSSAQINMTAPDQVGFGMAVQDVSTLTECAVDVASFFLG